MYGGKSGTPVRVGDVWATRIFDSSLENENKPFSVPLTFEVKHTNNEVIAQSWAYLRPNTLWYSNQYYLYILTDFDTKTRKATLERQRTGGGTAFPTQNETCFYFIPQTDNATVTPAVPQNNTPAAPPLPINGTDIVVGIISNVVPMFDDYNEGIILYYDVYVTIEGPVQVRWRYKEFQHHLYTRYFTPSEIRVKLPDTVGQMQLLFNEVVKDDERLCKAFLKRLCKTS